MRLRRLAEIVIVPLLIANATTARAAEKKAAVPAGTPALIPLKLLLGTPARVSPELSPEGRRLAWLEPDDKSVMQVWTQTLGGGDRVQVTHEPKRPVRRYFWSPDGSQILYLQDDDGDENFHVFGVDLASGNVRDFTPFRGVRADVFAAEQSVPGQILVQMNLRDRKVMDAYRLDLATGALTIDVENPGDMAGFVADEKLVVRVAQALLPDGGTEIRVRDGNGAAWRSLLKVPAGETVGVDGVAPGGKSLYLETSVGSDTTKLVEKDIATGAEKLIANSPEVDIGTVYINPLTHTVEAVGFTPDKPKWQILDPKVKADWDAIGKFSDGDCVPVGRDAKDTIWLAGCDSDHGPVTFWSWDRATKKKTFLFSQRPELEKLTLAPMEPVTITARDGLKMHAYLTLPVGAGKKNLPAVLYVHGGPWARDTWGFEPIAQWLANRGYAVLQVNYRGSDGYGKKFLHAGDKQWGFKMHDDLLDAEQWLIKQGYANPKKIGIVGGSYGGYSALAGVTLSPEAFTCSVDICGVSNLFTFQESIPAYWKPFLATIHLRVGDPKDPADEKRLRAGSPVFSADKIVRPLLIGQGANDPRVKQAESEQIVSAIEKHGGAVTYVLYSDEGHGFARLENRLDFFGRSEVFLGKYLGGRVDPDAGKKIEGSTAVVKTIGGGS